jgi:divalent metal cation (Fe/Co/Zn/Cd) transporter
VLEQVLRARERDWARTGLWLVGVTLAYNVVEAVVALAAGAAADSIALLGFGLDSGIEIAAAAVLLWRLSLETRGIDAEELERAERRVHRFVGATFLALAAYVSAQAGWTLFAREAPQASPVGIALASASLVIMPLVSWGKLRAAREIGSAALRAEAKETLACSYLSFALLLGLAANALAGCWWADPAAALAMVPWLIREGLEGLRAQGCDAGCDPPRGSPPGCGAGSAAPR